MLDALDLARIQFAFTVAFHIVFPAFSIGLASYLAVLEGLWLWRRQEVYLNTYKFWLKIFAVAFGMGVVSGLVMSYQFGTNWSVFSDKTGPVIGPLMGYEVLSAFFLEAGFLGVMLFGMKRVPPMLHFAATLLVAFGTFFSAFWILAVNSWMQTPQGFAVNEVGQFIPVSWMEVIFNPSFPFRLVHMVLAAYLTTALVVGAVGAFHLLRDRQNASARLMFSMALWMATVVGPAQIIAGDMHGLNTVEHQPLKIAAMEGHYETHEGAPLILFGIPDSDARETKYAVEVPGLASLILTHHLDGEVKGLEEWPREDWPNVPLVFWAFRIMVGIGVAIVALGAWSLWRRRRGKLYDAKWLQRASVLMGPAGFVAVVSGWVVTEAGRQPWVVYGALRTADAVSPIAAPAVGFSLAAFVITYLFVFTAGVFYLLRLMGKTPSAHEGEPPTGVPTRAAGITPASAMTPALNAPRQD
ncbi:MAG: cytochrome ubiquinol oxidase subunit I [Pseudomonadota bacterium]